jgi:hypothetical protein
MQGYYSKRRDGQGDTQQNITENKKQAVQEVHSLHMAQMRSVTLLKNAKSFTKVHLAIVQINPTFIFRHC